MRVCEGVVGSGVLTAVLGTLSGVICGRAEQGVGCGLSRLQGGVGRGTAVAE